MTNLSKVEKKPAFHYGGFMSSGRWWVMCLFIFCMQTFSARAQTLIAGWDFEGTSLPEGSTGTSRGGFFASAGTQVGVAEASGFHADRRTGWTTPSGNGSGKSLSATSWNVGDYFQFRVSSLGFSGLTVAWDQIRGSEASSNFNFSYSLDGTNFTSFAAYVVNSLATFADNSFADWWSGSTSAINTSYFYDLSSIASLDNQSSVFFRLVATSLSTDTRHRGAIDNVIVTGVPEPGSASLAALGLVTLLLRKRRCRR